MIDDERLFDLNADRLETSESRRLRELADQRVGGEPMLDPVDEESLRRVLATVKATANLAERTGVASADMVSGMRIALACIENEMGER